MYKYTHTHALNFHHIFQNERTKPAPQVHNEFAILVHSQKPAPLHFGLNGFDVNVSFQRLNSG